MNCRILVAILICSLCTGCADSATEVHVQEDRSAEHIADGAPQSAGGSTSPAATPPTPQEPMEPFQVEVSLVIEDQPVSARMHFCDHYAVEFDPDNPSIAAVIFDLDEMSWFTLDGQSPQTATLEACERWAEQSTELSRRSLATLQDETLKRFVEMQLKPEFAVSPDDDGLTLSNDILTYRVSLPQTMSELQRERFFAYDRLNAYRKAMMQQKMAPFVQLAVDDELETRQFVPGQIDMTVQTPAGPVNLVTNMAYSVLSEFETTATRELIGSALQAQ